MKYIILLFLSPILLFGQSLSVFDVNTDNFPIIKAKFYAYDASGNQILNLSKSDFEVKENGTPRNVTYVSCPDRKPPATVSVAMSIDISGSMSHSSFGDIPVELGKTTAKDLCNMVAMPPSEFALQTCHAQAWILQDFTTNKSKVLSAIAPLRAGGDNDFVQHLLNRLTGLLNIAKTGKNKRVAVLYTDAWWYPLTQQELQQCKDTCSKYNITFYAVIYSRPEAEPNGIKKSLQELAIFTHGYLYDGITSITAAKDIGLKLQQTAQEVNESCEIEWESGITCISGMTNVELFIPNLGLLARTSYQPPRSSIAKLEFNPSSVKFPNPEVGVKVEGKATVTARNSDFTITNITSNNGAFTISPTSFVLNAGQSRDLTVSYLPADSGYNYCTFTIENNQCPSYLFASGGWKGKKPTIRTLKLIHPNGAEVFVAGIDTIITWEGVSPDEPVKIEYSTNNGTKWITIADSTDGLSYNWRVPKTPSNQCLARVTANAEKSFFCDNPEVKICNQIWMGCNLDVDTYRNGEPIRYAETIAEWVDAGTKREGAWCYYNNDPANGEIYGKLYNWYAVNDPRGLAPEGWHIPSDAEWTTLENCLGGYTIAGGKLKSTGTIEGGDGLWYSTNTGATNESGFSALPGGWRLSNGTFDKLGHYGNWWSASDYYSFSTYSWYRFMYSIVTNLDRGYYNNEIGMSVRCVRY